MAVEKSVAIIIVNWKSWQDTILVAELCLRLDGFSGKIIIVDNASPDDSVDQLEAWIMGKSNSSDIGLEIPELNVILNTPRSAKLSGLSVGDKSSALCIDNNDKTVHLIKSSINTGFAGANNIGINYANSIGEFDAYWLLNPDAFPQKNALTALINSVEDWTNPIVIGSVLLEYYDPQKIQAVGAQLNKLTLSPLHLMEGEPRDTLEQMPEKISVEYPVGASLMINRAFVEQCGLLSEEYFLYFEEADLSRRAHPDNVFISRDSRVFHKGGASISPDGKAKASPTSEYYYIRSRIMFARKHGFFDLSKAIYGTMGSLAKRIIKGRLGILKITISAIWSGLSTPIKSNR